MHPYERFVVATFRSMRRFTQNAENDVTIDNLAELSKLFTVLEHRQLLIPALFCPPPRASSYEYPQKKFRRGLTRARTGVDGKFEIRYQNPQS